ncbi:unnamed protein product [Coffea canephora]|uniref:Uncharacterized protein n=1 Tax=Coffea canephora TaxID=49390 RepID=A0A068U355_COFCA|nr:unnamed protein product [Coffea canephora]
MLKLTENSPCQHLLLLEWDTVHAMFPRKIPSNSNFACQGKKCQADITPPVCLLSSSDCGFQLQALENASRFQSKSSYLYRQNLVRINRTKYSSKHP